MNPIRLAPATPLRSPPLALLATFAAIPAFATDSATLDNVVISAGAAKLTQISELPGVAWVVTAEELQEQTKAGIPLKEAIGNLVPGLDIGSQGRSNNDQNMRGRSVLVMIDGVSLNSSRNLSRQFDSIDPFNIERIEVISGANALYGAGATGGIINIITKHGEAGPARFTTEAGVRTGFNAGDDADWKLAQSVSGGNDWVVGRLGLAYQKNGAVYGADGKQVFTDITQTDLQYNQSIDLLGNLDFKLSGGQKLSVMAQYYDSGYDGDRSLYMGKNLIGSFPVLNGNKSDPSQLEMRDGFDSDRTPRTKRLMGQFDYFAPNILGGQDLYVQGYARQEKIDFFPFPGYTSTKPTVLYYGASQQNTDLYGLKAVLNKDWGDIFSLSYGLEASREEFDANQMLFDFKTASQSGGMQLHETTQIGRYPGVQTGGISAFAQAKWRLTDKLNLDFGLRQQHMKNSVDDFVAFNQQIYIANGNLKSADAVPGGSKSYDVTLPNVGVVYKLMPGSQVWANYSEGFELPDAAKWYGQGNYTTTGKLIQGVSVANSALDGIKTHQVELGWRYGRNGWQIQAAPFYTWSDKSLSYDSTTLLIKELNQKVRTYGLEGQVAYNLNDNWRVGSNFLAIKSEQQDSKGNWSKRDVTAASPSKVSLFTDWTHGDTALRLQGQQVFDLSDAAGNKLKGYAIFDLLGSQKLPVGTLNFGIQNLFNKQYQTLWSQRSQIYYGKLATPQTVYYEGRGRTYGVTYTVNY
ncbi:TonB-dependent receptor [Crenobacter sp. SG2305]|uniref:TonB-dependent receptor n=1 Tax=Crenobacter oryzisoli TaxID=3056844 RepID=UPI0025AAE59B|nr:TonB-dependent receptor [Crenobacter sp. SG2305]MDN0081587.1 TonB-dependent receptor [Crenobacter sp. SG2305]